MRQEIEAELLIEAVRALGGKQPAPEALQLRVGQDHLHEPFGQSPAPVLFQHEDVGQVAEGGPVGDHPGEADLFLSVVDAETERVGNRSGDELALRILLTHIAVNGPKLRADVVRMAKHADASMVVCGHSHVPFIGEDRGLVMFNPGSAGPRRFSLPILFGTLDFGPEGVRLTHIDCETGERAEPIEGVQASGRWARVCHARTACR